MRERFSDGYSIGSLQRNFKELCDAVAHVLTLLEREGIGGIDARGDNPSTYVTLIV
jgi:hypothetical protein